MMRAIPKFSRRFFATFSLHLPYTPSLWLLWLLWLWWVPSRQRLDEVNMKKKDEIERNAMFEQGLLYCTRCKKFLPFKEFSKNGQENYGYNFKCKNCRKEYERANGYHEAAKKRIKDGYRANKELLINLLGGKCQRCGFSDGIFALEFHHVYPNGKSMVPSLLIAYKDIDRTKREIDKCALLCSNCHKSFKKNWTCEFLKLDFGYTVTNVSRI